MCARNVLGGWTNPNLVEDELTLSQVQTILHEDFVQQLDRVYLCGNYGDPMVAKDTIPVLRYLRDVKPDISLGIHTNGSGRNHKWWSELAELFQPGTRSSVVFSIDGLEDTNHLYRKRTQWSKIMAAAKSFIGAGGVADWEFLLFQHNQHQVEEARALAKSMGFRQFQVKKTGRFTQKDTMGWVDAHPVYNSDGSLSHVIRPADDKNEAYQGKAREAKFWEQIKPPKPKEFPRFDPDADFGQAGEYAKDTCIKCKALTKREVFISYQGYVLPCCFLAFPLDNWGKNNDNHQTKQMLTDYGLDRLDATKHRIEDIIQGPLFTQTIPMGWIEGTTVKQGKLLSCASHCGAKSHVNGEYEDQATSLN